MKLFFRIIIKIFLALTILAGCVTTEEIEETDPVTLLHQGQSFFSEGQIDRSIRYFNKAIEINPNLVWAFFSRGVAYFAKAESDKACSDWKRMCKLGVCEFYEQAERTGLCNYLK